jgi:hypothetical protein
MITRTYWTRYGVNELPSAQKRGQLDRAIQAIRETETALAGCSKPDWKIFIKIIKEIEMHNNTEWMKKYYSDEAKSKLEERKGLWSPELQARVSQQWSELFADIEASLDEDPGGPKAQALLTRWRNLVAEFSGVIQVFSGALTPCMLIGRTGHNRRNRALEFGPRSRTSFGGRSKSDRHRDLLLTWHDINDSISLWRNYSYEISRTRSCKP